MTLYDFVTEALDRLGDLDQDIWTRSEMELYIKDGYDAFCRRTKCLFDIHVIENLPKTANWQTDLERYIAEQKSGWGLTDEPFHMTALHERNVGVGASREVAGSYAVSPANITSPSEREFVGVTDGPGEDIPTTVPGGPMPKSLVEVLRVAYDRQDLAGISSQQMRTIDPNYETRSGDPQWYIFDKDGLYYMRVVPAAQGDAVYDTVSGSFGTLTETTDTTVSSSLSSYWPMEDGTSASTVYDVYGLRPLTVSSSATSATGKNNNGLILDPWARSATGALAAGKFTLSEWLKPSGASNSGNILWMVSSTTTTLKWVSSSGKLNLTQGATSEDGTTTLSSASYAHIVWTYDGNVTHKLYVNGALEITMTAPAVSTGTNTLSVLDGESASHDELSYYTDELSAAEVLLLYNDGNGVFYPDIETTSASVTVVTTEPSGKGTSGFGILRSREGAEGWFPAGGPWGTITRVHPDDLNIKVEMYRLGRDLKSHVSELPSAYNKYVVYWAMHRALKRSGPGQDIELAEHYGQRFEMGVSRMNSKRNKIQPERVGRFGGNAQTRDFALGLPQAPYPYEVNR